MDEAEAMVIDRSPIIDATGMLECALSAYVVLVRIAAHRRNIERAYALLEQLENLGHMCKWGRMVAAALAIRLRLYLTEGRLKRAARASIALNGLRENIPLRHGAHGRTYATILCWRVPFWGRPTIASRIPSPFCEHCARRR